MFFWCPGCWSAGGVGSENADTCGRGRDNTPQHGDSCETDPRPVAPVSPTFGQRTPPGFISRHSTASSTCPKKCIRMLPLCLPLTRFTLCALAPNQPATGRSFLAVGPDAIPGPSANSAAFPCLLTLGFDFLLLLSFALGSGEADRKSSLASSFLGAA